MDDIVLLVNYFYNKALCLSLDFPKQEQEAKSLCLGDYYTEDIANEWFSDEVDILKHLAEDGKISIKASEIYKKIDDNFSIVSKNGAKYDPEIWTLRALMNHPFWEEQRELAKTLIKELEVYTGIS